MSGAPVNALSARTWYEDTGIAAPKTGRAEDAAGPFDLAIIGGGLAGLSLLLKASQAGLRTLLLEKDSIGAGASGRNGGFCTPGWAADEAQIARVMGADAVGPMAELAAAGLSWMHARMQRKDYAGTMPVTGALTTALSGPVPTRLGPEETLYQASDLAPLLSTRRYRFGVYTPVGLHFHPLNFMRGLAREAMAAGGVILENTALTALRADAGNGWRLKAGTAGPRIHARKVVLATGGYGGAEYRPLENRLLPIRTYIGVTSPMPDLLDRHIACNWAIADTRRAGNYYRRLNDGRLLWGMAITAFGTMAIDAVRRMVMRDIAAIYPGLARDMRSAGREIEYGWAGNMAYAPHFLPYVGPLAPDLFALSGFGGHGMNTAPAAADVLVQYLLGQRDDVGPFQRIPYRRTFGLLGRGAAEASYRFRRIEDRLAERRQR